MLQGQKRTELLGLIILANMRSFKVTQLFCDTSFRSIVVVVFILSAIKIKCFVKFYLQ